MYEEDEGDEELSLTTASIVMPANALEYLQSIYSQSIRA